MNKNKKKTTTFTGEDLSKVLSIAFVILIHLFIFLKIVFLK